MVADKFPNGLIGLIGPNRPYYLQNSTSISEINFLLEVIRYNARRISRRWAVHEVLPIAKIIRQRW